MATYEEISFLKERFAGTMQSSLTEKLNLVNLGIGSLLNILDNAEGKQFTCGDISQIMKVSTARVATILKKAEARGLINRSCHEKDKRITIVTLTSEGRNAIKQMNLMVDSLLDMLINELGMDKLRQFFSLAEQITNAFKTKTVLPKLPKEI